MIVYVCMYNRALWSLFVFRCMFRSNFISSEEMHLRIDHRTFPSTMIRYLHSLHDGGLALSIWAAAQPNDRQKRLWKDTHEPEIAHLTSLSKWDLRREIRTAQELIQATVRLPEAQPCASPHVITPSGSDTCSACWDPNKIACDFAGCPHFQEGAPLKNKIFIVNQALCKIKFIRGHLAFRHLLEDNPRALPSLASLAPSFSSSSPGLISETSSG